LNSFEMYKPWSAQQRVLRCASEKV